MKGQEFITPIDQYVIDFVRKLRDVKELRQQDIGFNNWGFKEFIKDIENTNKRAKYNVRHINALADYFDMSPKDFLPEKPMKLFSDSRKEKTQLKRKATVKKAITKKKVSIIKKK
jgi:hypothetical protein